MNPLICDIVCIETFFFSLIESDLSMYLGMFREILIVVPQCDVVTIVYMLASCVYSRKLDRSTYVCNSRVILLPNALTEPFIHYMKGMKFQAFVN